MGAYQFRRGERKKKAEDSSAGSDGSSAHAENPVMFFHQFAAYPQSKAGAG